MKKLVFAIALVLATMTVAVAQSPAIKVDAAVNFSNVTAKAGNNKSNGDMLIGYRVGAAAEFGFAQNFYVSPGIVLLSRGQKNTWLHQIEIPVNVGVRYGFAPNMGVSLQAGPYFAIGYLGKVKTDVGSYDPYKGFELPVVGQVGAMKRFDVGMGAQVAFEYSRYYAMLGTEWGFLNMLDTKNASLTNNNFYVGVGIRF